MKNKKRLTLLIALATMLIFVMLVNACAPTADAPVVEEEEPAEEAPMEEEKVITVLYLEDPPFWKEQAERFTEATGIKVIWEGVPFGNLHDKMLTGMVGGSSPWDVIHVRDDYVSEFASRGLLLPLDDYVTSEMRSQSAEQAWENLMWDGVQYGIPRYYWLWQFYYNTEVFEAAGITESPKTWEELATLAEQLTIDTDGDGEVDQYGYCEPWGENFSASPFEFHLAAAGGTMFDDAGYPEFNSEAGVRALTWMVEMAKTDNFCPSAFELMHTSTASEIFAQGNVAMLASSASTLRLVSDPDKSNVVGKVAVGLFPGDVEVSASRSETGALGIPATAAHPDLAMEYIKFVTSFDEEKLMALEIGSIPAVTDALNDPEVQAKYPHFEWVSEQMKYPFGMIKHQNAAEVNAALSRHIIAALQGDETPEEALAKAEEEILAIVNQP